MLPAKLMINKIDFVLPAENLAKTHGVYMNHG